MSAKTSLTIVCASKGSNQPRETCCQFCHSPLKAMNTGVVTKLATGHGERLPNRLFQRWWKKCQPCVVIKVLAMSCHRAVCSLKLECPSPRSSPHSSVAGRGRKNMRDGKSSRRTMILTCCTARFFPDCAGKRCFATIRLPRGFLRCDPHVGSCLSVAGQRRKD
jgi:hypothetical protein